MSDLKDLHNSLVAVTLQEPKLLADADSYSDYVDTQGYNGISFVIMADSATGDASNYTEPYLYGTNHATPATFANYTLCASTEYQGSFASIDDQLDHISKLSLKEHKYRYYCVFFDVESTPAVTASVACVMSGRHQPVGADSVTTSAVS